MGSIERPIIPITLRNKGITTETFGLIDSGSDLTILHGDLSYLLDVDVSMLQTTAFSGIKKGAEAHATGYLFPLEIGIEQSFFKIPVLFSFDIPSSVFGILGQVGLFDNFIIEFERANKRVLLK